MNFTLFLFPKSNDCQMDRALLFIPNFCFIWSYLGVTILLVSTEWYFLFIFRY